MSTPNRGTGAPIRRSSDPSRQQAWENSQRITISSTTSTSRTGSSAFNRVGSTSTTQMASRPSTGTSTQPRIYSSTTRTTSTGVTSTSAGSSQFDSIRHELSTANRAPIASPSPVPSSSHLRSSPKPSDIASTHKPLYGTDFTPQVQQSRQQEPRLLSYHTMSREAPAPSQSPTTHDVSTLPSRSSSVMLTRRPSATSNPEVVPTNTSHSSYTPTSSSTSSSSPSSLSMSSTSSPSSTLQRATTELGRGTYALSSQPGGQMIEDKLNHLERQLTVAIRSSTENEARHDRLSKELQNLHNDICVMKQQMKTKPEDEGLGEKLNKLYTWAVDRSPRIDAAIKLDERMKLAEGQVAKTRDDVAHTQVKVEQMMKKIGEALEKSTEAINKARDAEQKATVAETKSMAMINKGEDNLVTHDQMDRVTNALLMETKKRVADHERLEARLGILEIFMSKKANDMTADHSIKDLEEKLMNKVNELEDEMETGKTAVEKRLNDEINGRCMRLQQWVEEHVDDALKQGAEYALQSSQKQVGDEAVKVEIAKVTRSIEERLKNAIEAKMMTTVDGIVKQHVAEYMKASQQTTLAETGADLRKEIELLRGEVKEALTGIKERQARVAEVEEKIIQSEYQMERMGKRLDKVDSHLLVVDKRMTNLANEVKAIMVRWNEVEGNIKEVVESRPPAISTALPQVDELAVRKVIHDECESLKAEITNHVEGLKTRVNCVIEDTNRAILLSSEAKDTSNSLVKTLKDAVQRVDTTEVTSKEALKKALQAQEHVAEMVRKELTLHVDKAGNSVQEVKRLQGIVNRMREDVVQAITDSATAEGKVDDVERRIGKLENDVNRSLIEVKQASDEAGHAKAIAELARRMLEDAHGTLSNRDTKTRDEEVKKGTSKVSDHERDVNEVLKVLENDVKAVKQQIATVERHLDEQTHDLMAKLASVEHRHSPNEEQARWPSAPGAESLESQDTSLKFGLRLEDVEAMAKKLQTAMTAVVNQVSGLEGRIGKIERQSEDEMLEMREITRSLGEISRRLHETETNVLEMNSGSTRSSNNSSSGGDGRRSNSSDDVSDRTAIAIAIGVRDDVTKLRRTVSSLQGNVNELRSEADNLTSNLRGLAVQCGDMDLALERVREDIKKAKENSTYNHASDSKNSINTKGSSNYPSSSSSGSDGTREASAWNSQKVLELETKVNSMSSVLTEKVKGLETKVSTMDDDLHKALIMAARAESGIDQLRQDVHTLSSNITALNSRAMGNITWPT